MEATFGEIDFAEENLVKLELVKIGLDFEAETWVVSSHIQSAADAPVVFHWPKIFTDLAAYAGANGYCHVLKTVAGCLLTGVGARRYAPNTTMTNIVLLRSFLLTLLANNHDRLSLITPGQLDFLIQKYRVNTMSGEPNATATLTSRMNLISQLYRLKRYIGDGLNFEPFPANNRRRISRGLKESIFWEAPPEPVCLHLLRRSIEVVENLSEDMIRLFSKYSNAAEEAVGMGLKTKKTISSYALAAISDERFTSALHIPEVGSYTILNTVHLGYLKNQLVTACFIVITYTCGPRVSEVRRATSASLRTIEHLGGRPFDYYFAPRSKQRFTSRINSSAGASDVVPWVLSPIASEAFRIMREISRPLRKRSGIDNLWLTSTGNSLWAFKPKHLPGILTSGQFNQRLNSFAKFIDLEGSTGWNGRLHSHMGRKFLARFIAKRDRSYLGDLAVQFSHTTSDSVDYSYAQPDEDFRAVVKEEVAAEIDIVVDILVGSSPELIFLGATGSERTSQLKNFIGQCRSSRDVKKLLAKGALLVPCQWGLCLYRQETSACSGSKKGPDPSNRTPAICKGCTNFLATPRHAQWWRDYEEDSLRVLKQKNIPMQTKMILEERLKDAQSVLKSIDGEGRDDG